MNEYKCELYRILRLCNEKIQRLKFLQLFSLTCDYYNILNGCKNFDGLSVDVVINGF
jgi:hypothetical protein